MNDALFLFSRMYSNCTGPGFSLHSDVIMPYISKYGSKEQIERYIPQMTAGKCIAAIGMTEPGAGRSGLKRGCKHQRNHTAVMWCRFHVLSLLPFSDLQGMKTYAKRDGADWILNGNKVLSHKSRNGHFTAPQHELEPSSISLLQVFISNGWMSDLVVVMAVTDREAKTAAHGISLFLVESGAKGFQKGRKLEKIGLKAQVRQLGGRLASGRRECLFSQSFLLFKGHS